MTPLEHALSAAARGLHVFPLRPGTKLPVFARFYEVATTDEATIRGWWAQEPRANIGLSMTLFNGGKLAGVGVDLDVKPEHDGREAFAELDTIHGFPITYAQRTPSGGEHRVYAHPFPLSQRELAPGIDTRSNHGYLVGAGSVIPEGVYTVLEDAPLAPLPLWIAERLGRARTRSERAPAPEVNQDRAHEWALEYLRRLPVALAGNRDNAAYRAACKVRDLGLDEAGCVDAMVMAWRSDPELTGPEIARVVASAYAYAIGAPGDSNPEVHFSPVPPEETPSPANPIEQLNQEHAFVLIGGAPRVLWETTDHKGRFHAQNLTLDAARAKLAPLTFTPDGGKPSSMFQRWFHHPDRRSFDGVCFAPGSTTPLRFYNLWRGFAYTPLERGVKPGARAQRGLDAFLTHLRVNVCADDAKLAHWRAGYFAHIIQKPEEKPLTSLVFQGPKGVGKTSLVDRVGALLGPHYLVASDPRYLTGNFNAYMEGKLLFVLEEAHWGGDRKSNGILNHLITGSTQVIERKGVDPFEVDSFTRLVMIGNDNWIAPASEDERRYDISRVGMRMFPMQTEPDKRIVRDFFETMRLDMEEAGGYELLLRFLLDFDLTGIDVREAPNTEGLLDQKERSLKPIHQWWLEILREGRIVESDIPDWPELVEKHRVRDAFRRYAKGRQMTGWMETDQEFGAQLKRACPKLDVRQRGPVDEKGTRPSAYRFPSLEEARAAWATFIGHPVRWG